MVFALIEGKSVMLAATVGGGCHENVMLRL